MRFVIVFEAAGDASAALAFRARTIAPDADIVAPVSYTHLTLPTN